MAQKQSNVTINWKGKKGQRGLTQVTMDLLKKMMENNKEGKFKDLFTKLEEIESDYSDLLAVKVFDLDKEIKMISKYVRVLL